MFERADRLWLSQVEPRLPYHAMELDWRGFEPALVCIDRIDDSPVDLDLKRVDFVISERRVCVGRFDGDRHLPCPNSTSVSTFVQCANCAEESFIPYQECIFEPKCDGDLCDIDFCRREHVLYLAFYNSRVKIGMSSSRRIEKRLIEQGADAYALIGAFPSRKSARTAEKEISADLAIPQAFRQRTLLDDLAKRIDISVVEERYAELSASLETVFGLSPGALQWLDAYPIELPLDARPHLRETPGRHRGEMIGVKGKWLIYHSSGMNALSLADVPSRFVGEGMPL